MKVIKIKRAIDFKKRPVKRIIFRAEHKSGGANLFENLLRVLANTVVRRKKFGLETRSVRVHRMNAYSAATGGKLFDKVFFVFRKRVKKHFGNVNAHAAKDVERVLDLFATEKTSGRYSGFHCKPLMK